MRAYRLLTLNDVNCQPSGCTYYTLSRCDDTSIIYCLCIILCAMAKGTVAFFNDTGGYGFIESEDSEEDVFFHMEDVGGPDLEEGQEVEFDIEQADKGPRATNLQRL